MTLSNEPLEVLLENNFYKTYSSEVQSLLEECSFLDSFTSEQAVCITGNADAPGILRGLLTSNALIVFHEESSIIRLRISLRRSCRRRQRVKAVQRPSFT